MPVGAAVDILSAALQQANITENAYPQGWILISHGVGGLYSRVFASRHTAATKSLLLVDAIPEDLIPKFFTAKRTFILLIRGLISPLGIDRLAGWIFKGRSMEDRVWGRSSWRDDRRVKSELQESLVAGSISAGQVTAAQAIIPKTVPFVVVSSGQECHRDKEWEKGQKELALGGGRNGTWDVVENAGHQVWMNDEGKRILKKRLSEIVKGATVRT
jgi:pimeloyl-ACP methyl ester carboxylesterase